MLTRCKNIKSIVECLMTTALQKYCWVFQWKKFKICRCLMTFSSCDTWRPSTYAFIDSRRITTAAINVPVRTSWMSTASLRSRLFSACRHHRWRHGAPEPRDDDVTTSTRRIEQSTWRRRCSLQHNVVASISASVRLSAMSCCRCWKGTAAVAVW